MKALSQYASKRDGCRKDLPPAAALRFLLDRLATDFKACLWDIPDDFLSWDHYLRAVSSLDWTSSPGYPHMRRATSNGQFFGVKDGKPDPERVRDIWAEVQDRLEALERGELAADHIRLFVKAEPLKPKKVLTNSFRLISSVSVVDQIIDHMLFDGMNETMYDNWDKTPSRVGWSPFCGGWRVMPRGKSLALDKSSWDWTVQMWMIDVVLRLRTKLCRNVNEKWLSLAKARYLALFDSPTFITSGGMILKQRQPGVMKSGCVNTIADNTIMQIMLHYRVVQELGWPVSGIVAMGDDTLQQPVVNERQYLDKMSEYCIVKQIEHKTEFAGMLFDGRSVEPVYCGKHAFTLLHMDPKIEQDLAVSYTLLYHRSKYRDWFENLFSDMGLEVPDRDWRDAIYDSLE
uniref:RdRp catalytic domain-containing protein n=1 Tax=Riboviria sp. TaxID=2585031 RepID=A0A8K1WQ08_9VIRU|nr:MAG: hypothetical protein 1 [Riboviria sp.]